MARILFILSIGLICLGQASAQGFLERLGKKAIEKTEEHIEENVSKVLDTNETKSQKNNQQDENPIKEIEPLKLKSTTTYDFIPGDTVLFYEDFSQDAIGDFPVQWTTDGSGEVKTINLMRGNWLHMNTEGKKYQLLKSLEFPENYIVEFDVIFPKMDVSNNGLWITLYKAEGNDNGAIEYFSFTNGYSLLMEYGEEWQELWHAQSYSPDGYMVRGDSKISMISADKVEHVIIWVQKRRFRVYHSGKKVLDMPTLLYNGLKPNRLVFELASEGQAFVSNIRITTASPDTRNKLLKEGKLISYGIYFDVNSDKINPESSGTLNNIAKVIKDAGDIKIQIVGHTDSSGEDAFNLDLSKRRAFSVKNELVKMGVTPDNLSTDGAGELMPIAPNDNPSNKSLNRRVEFIKL